MSATKERERFDTLRACYIAARDRRDELEREVRATYGDGWQFSWLKSSTARRIESRRAAQQKAADAFSAHLKRIAPRDWSYGVPAYWLYERLTYEDAVRPVNEPLSVVPPLAYGYTTPRT